MNFLSKLFGESTRGTDIPLLLYNTLTKKKDIFTMPGNLPVKMYNCGPTPYDRQHIGNLSMAVFTDVLKRALQYNGYRVQQVMNITDFGHLVSDADDGEDKMSKGLRREGKDFTLENMLELAEKYTEIFLDDVAALGVNTKKIQYPRASKFVDAQIAMIQTLADKGYTYETSDGVYFATKQFPGYGALGGITKEEDAEARAEANSEKQNAHDFALWKKSEDIGWDSPWGKGFPGWHIECSAINRAIFGQQIDIHTGGIEHVAIHHNNEIAQSECSSGKQFARFWLHREHVQLDNEKISKSIGNVFYLSDLEEKGFHPLAYRYWLLTAHYRSSSSFSWEALEAAQTALLRLYKVYKEVSGADVTNPVNVEKERTEFQRRINDDLDTPSALAHVWETLKRSDYTDAQKFVFLTDADRVFGLSLHAPDEHVQELLRKEFGEEASVSELPEDVKSLVEEREKARAEKNFERSDEIRDELAQKGYTLEDTPEGQKVKKR